ncbi:MAG: sugar-binding protein, partial [Planctomycetota bacterium]|jgi:hypothetical protein
MIKVKLKHFVLCFSVVIAFIFVDVNANAERFFQKNSTWYEKIPDNPSVYTDSDAKVTAHCNEIQPGRTRAYGCAWVAFDGSGEFGAPIYYADTETPNITVTQSGNSDFWERWILPNAWNIIPIPEGAVASGYRRACISGEGYDGHLVIVNRSTNEVWDFFGARNCTGLSTDWASFKIRKWDLTTDGVNQPFTNPGGARAAHNPLLHGIITYQEVVLGPDGIAQNGDEAIEHALSIVVDCAESNPSNPDSYGVYPAKVGWPYSVPCFPNALSIGHRIQLDPAIDCNTYYGTNLNTSEKALCNAMQQYGAIVVDSGGFSAGIILEELWEHKQNNNRWNNIDGNFIFTRLNSKMKWTDMRVIEPLKPPFNTSQTYQCSDGIDNDDDNLTDYPNDPGCSSSTDNDEHNALSEQNTIESLKTISPVTIDGILSENVWNQANNVTFSNSSRSDNEVKVYALWDNTNLYFAFDVTDANIEATDGNLWSDDGIALYIDTLHNESTSMDADDYQFLSNINDKLTGGSIIIKTNTRANGYITEVAVPWNSINITPSEVATMGLLLTNNDRDNTEHDHFDWLTLIESGNYLRPNLWGDLILSNGQVGSVDSTPPAPPMTLLIH